MKKEKLVGNILFWATLISPSFSFPLACLIGEVYIFSILGMIRYSWIMFLFIPIGILSILIGLKLKNNKQKYKKNFVISFICLPFLIIFGSYRFIFNNVVSYDATKVSNIAEKIKINIPNEIKVATDKINSYNISYVKIINNDSKEKFEEEIRDNQLWQSKLNIVIKSLLPYEIQTELDSFDYFLFYNITSEEYNMLPQNGQYECIFITYDSDLQRLIILDDYVIDLN